MILVIFRQLRFRYYSIGSFPLQIETTSEVYVGDFGYTSAITIIFILNK